MSAGAHRLAVSRSIVFLCQACHGELEPISVRHEGKPVWECANCKARWIWRTLRWQRIKDDVQVLDLTRKYA